MPATNMVWHYHPITGAAITENAAPLVDEIIGMTQDCGPPSIMSGLKLHRKSRNEFPLSFDLNGYSITLDFPKKPSNVGELKASAG